MEGIHTDWFTRLRGGLALGYVLVLGGAQVFLPLQLPALELAVVLVGVVLSNLALAWWRRDNPATLRLLLTLMSLDVLVLTFILYLTGGPLNPFSSLYLVYVAWAAVVLTPRATWALSVLAFAGFGLLFFWSQPLIWTGPGAHAHGHMWHLQGMWVSFGLSAALIVYFVQRLTRAIEARDAEVRRLRAAEVKADRLVALGTLSAGAAHELATPLSTIAVVAKELQRSLEKEGGHAEAVEDAQLVRAQVQRCRDILDRMAADAGEVAGEPSISVTAQGLLDAVRAKLSEAEWGRVQVDFAPNLVLGALPLKALARGVHGLVSNALHASGAEGVVHLHLGVLEHDVVVEVKDEGVGMEGETLARVGEPFFTTKPPGVGMGLGVFLSRTVAERLGGSLTYASVPSRGTTATLRLPLAARRRPVA